MRGYKSRIQVRDVLFEASFDYARVIAWEVTGIYIKDSVTPETVVVVHSPAFGYVEKSPETVCCWHDTYQEAFECLKEMVA